MAKPFKSEFDLMAEAYGTISYKKQAIINEHTSARRVIGYPPQVITEGDKVDEVDDNPGGGSTPVHPDEAAEHSPVAACTAAIDAIAQGDTSAIKTCISAIDELAATLQGDEKVAVYEDLRDYIKGSLHGSDVEEDLSEYLNASLRGRPDEDAESVPGMNHRIDSMIDRDELGAAQAALQNILADLHAHGEEFEADDVAAFIASTLS